MKIFISVFFTLLISAGVLKAQCGNRGSFQQHQLLQRSGFKNAADMESALRSKIQDRSRARMAASSDAYFTVPVVVHVVQRASNLRQAGEDPTDMHIQGLISSANDLLRKKPGSAGDGNGVDTKIELCLASIDTNGNATTGIVRHDASAIAGYNSYGIYQEGPGPNNAQAIFDAYNWNDSHTGAQYLNIYLVWSIDNGQSGVAGFASYGVVMGVTQSPKVLVHEVGHWLGLSHTFEGGCGETDCETGGDQVCDTPPTTQADASNAVGCVAQINSCGVIPQIENYMDYTPQMCQNMFTAGQRDRMWGWLDMMNFTSVGPLATAGNLAKTGCGTTAAAIGYVKVASLINCAGTPVVVSQKSDPSKYTSLGWSFPGGSPSSSTSESPAVVYNSPGTYTLSLSLTNNWGTSTFTKDIQVVNHAAPVADNATINKGASANLSASGNGMKRWYLQSDPSTVVHTGNTFTTPALSSNTVYLVESVDTTFRQHLGEINLSGNTYGSGGAAILFDVFKPVRLKAITVFDVGLEYTIVVKNKAGATLYSQSVPKRVSSATDPVRVRKIINVDLPAGTDYSVEFPSGSNPSNSGLGTVFDSHFPYTLEGYISLKESDDFFVYGYFFDWEIEHEDFYCKSQKVPVNVTVQDPAGVQGALGGLVKLYPNPFEDQLILEMENGLPLKVEVYDVMGRILKQQEFANNRVAAISLAEFSQNTFMIKLISKDQSEIVKVIKK